MPIKSKSNLSLWFVPWPLASLFYLFNYISKLGVPSLNLFNFSTSCLSSVISMLSRRNVYEFLGLRRIQDSPITVGVGYI